VRLNLPADGVREMGLDDEAEKLKQAEQWAIDGTQDQREASLDYVGHILVHSDRPDLRKRAWALLRRLEVKDRAQQ
jgi:hypothetical protein